MHTLNEEIKVFIEGGTLEEQRLVSSVINRALARTGFEETHNYNEHGQEIQVSPYVAEVTFPTVIDYLRENHPNMFQTPVVVSAYAPVPQEHERRQNNRIWLQAMEVASSASYLEPDERWQRLDEREKEHLLMVHEAERYGIAV